VCATEDAEAGWTLTAADTAEAEKWRKAITSTISQIKAEALADGGSPTSNGAAAAAPAVAGVSAAAAQQNDATPTRQRSATKEAPQTKSSAKPTKKASAPPAAPTANGAAVERKTGEVAAQDDQQKCLVTLAAVKDGDICLLLRSDGNWRYAKLDHKGVNAEMVFVVNQQGHHKIIPVEGQKDFVRYEVYEMYEIA
jgi:hypothetical protein